jgi:hypothetical protein
MADYSLYAIAWPTGGPHRGERVKKTFSELHEKKMRCDNLLGSCDVEFFVSSVGFLPLPSLGEGPPPPELFPPEATLVAEAPRDDPATEEKCVLKVHNKLEMFCSLFLDDATMRFCFIA